MPTAWRESRFAEAAFVRRDSRGGKRGSAIVIREARFAHTDSILGRLDVQRRSLRWNGWISATIGFFASEGSSRFAPLIRSQALVS